MSFNPIDLIAVLPEMVVLALAIIVLLVELTLTRNNKTLQAITVAGLLAVVVIALLDMLGGPATGAFNGMVARDGTTAFMKALLAGAALLATLMSREYFTPPYSPPTTAEGDGSPPLKSPPANSGGGNEEQPPLTPPFNRSGGSEDMRHGEYYALMLLSTFGMMILVSATDLLTVFLGIETMSIPLYILAGIRPERQRSSEAALKYFLLGAFSTGFLLYGMALLYGISGGETNLSEIGKALGKIESGALVYLYAGMGLTMIGLLFKVAAVPFNF